MEHKVTLHLSDPQAEVLRSALIIGVENYQYDGMEDEAKVAEAIYLAVRDQTMQVTL